MNCDQARRYLSAYLDSELEPTPSLEIARHLEVCEPCRLRFDAETRLEKGIAAVLEREGHDTLATERILRFLDAPGRAGRPAVPPRRIRRRTIAVAAFLAVTLLAILTWKLGGGNGAPPAHVEMDLAAEVFDHHRRFQDGSLVPVAGSTSLDAANGIFRRGLPFRCELSAPPSGFEVRGALSCKFQGTPAACLKASHEGGDVSVFAIAESGLDRFPMAAERFAKGGDEVHCRVEGLDFVMVRRAGVVLTVIGRRPAGELFALARELAAGF